MQSITMAIIRILLKPAPILTLIQFQAMVSSQPFQIQVVPMPVPKIPTQATFRQPAILRVPLQPTASTLQLVVGILTTVCMLGVVARFLLTLRATTALSTLQPQPV